MIEAVSSVNSGAVPLISRDEFAHLGDGYILTNKTDPDPGDPSLPRRNRTREYPTTLRDLGQHHWCRIFVAVCDRPGPSLDTIFTSR